MTLDPDLVDTVTDTLAEMAAVDLAALRAAATPILAGWARAVQMPDELGVLQTVDPADHGDVPILVVTDGTGAHVTDFAFEVTDSLGSYWRLGSGDAVLDGDADPIGRPSFADVLAQAPAAGEWDVFTGEQIGFLERYSGRPIAIDQAPLSTGGATADAVGEMIDTLWTALNLVTVRIAMQGPLAEYFPGLAYDAATDNFHATTAGQLVPMFEAIFADAPGDAGGAADWLASWKPITDVILGDFDRGEDRLVTYSYVFQNIVAAYESIGLPIAITDAAEAMGLPDGLVLTGSGTMNGTSDPDIFYMTAGNQAAHGGVGADAYVFGGGFGQDTIDDDEAPVAPHDPDMIRFASVDSDEVTATRDGLDLIIAVDGTSDAVRVVGQFEGRLPGIGGGGDLSSETGVAEVVFADGVVWDAIDIARAVSHPLATNDSLEGTPSVDFLDGGTGNDTLSGGDDADIYRFGTGYGSDVIRENQGNVLLSAPDFVEFGPGLAAGEISFHRAGNSDDLVVRIDGAADQLTIEGQFDATYPGVFQAQWLDRIEAFYFEDGAYYTAEDVMRNLVADGKTSGNDTIYGFSIEDRLDGGAGNDYLSGGNENDTYIFGQGYGHDTVEDNLDNILSGETDTVRFGAGIEEADVTWSRDGSSNDLQATLTDGSQLTVKGQFDATYAGPFGMHWFDRIENFVFQGESGTTTVTANGIMDTLLEQGKTSGNDTIYGFFREDTLDGGTGDDRLDGGNEADTYLFGIDSGHDTISDTADNIFFPDPDRVLFGAGIAPGDLQLSRPADLDDLLVSTAGTSDTLLIKDKFNADNLGNRLYDVEEFHFAGGAAWSADQIMDAYLIQAKTGGDDTIHGFFRVDTLDGGAGNDRLFGGDDGDTYLFGIGSGQDVVRDEQTSIFFTAADKVVLGAGITTSNIHLARSGDDLVITVDGVADRLTIEDQFDTSNLGDRFEEIEQLKFANGTVWTRADIQTKLLQGSSGNDLLVGFFGPDTLDGGAGDDTLKGGDDGDTYKFGIGYGHDLIRDDQTSIFYANPDKVVFGAGITTSDVHLWRSGDDLVIGIDQTDDQLTIQKQFTTNGLGGRLNEVEQLKFADGTIWTRTDIQTILLTGSEGNDLMVGFSSPDLLDGGHGNDTLKGGDGGDTYIFELGSGHDTIQDIISNVALDYADKLVFGEGIAPADILLSRSSDNLILAIAGTSDSVTLIDQFNYNTLGHRYDDVEQIRFADGTIWYQHDIQIRLLQSTDGNDNLVGFGDVDTLDGGLGDDTLQGFDYGDTYIFGLGYGHDLIIDHPASIFLDDPADTVSFGSGITPDNLRLSKNGNDAIIEVVGTNDQLTIRDQFDTGVLNYKMDQFQFTSGTVWTAAAFAAMFLAGTASADNLTGSAGADYINGAAGADTMTSGAGHDTYVVDNAGDLIIELSSEGTDYVESTITLTLAANVEVLILKGSGAINGTGNSLDNLLIGNGAANSLDGGTGADTLLGGAGNDSYTVDNSGDQVTELAGQGTDAVTSSIDYTLVANVENLTLTGSAISGTGNTLGNSILGNASANTLYGLGGDDTLDGGAGADTLTGGIGNDLYVIDASDTVVEATDEGIDTIQVATTYSLLGDFENLTLSGTSAVNGTGNTLDNVIIGNSAANSLTGDVGDDTLNGMAGSDTLTGGTGNDMYVVDSATDTIVEGAGNGIDIVESSIAYTLSNANLENLTLIGTGNINATGNSGDNVIAGNSGNNTLNGGTGIDTLVGGAGNDVFVVDSTTDTIIEFGSEGSDRIDSSVTYSIADLPYIESLTLTGSSAINGTGNSWHNGIVGNSGANQLSGGDGNDVINGGAGADTMIGGLGDDTLVIDNAGDVVTEASAEGTDTIQVPFTYTLGANFENLTLSGSSAINGTGNDVNNSILGNNGANQLTGGNGDDTLDGGSGADTLTGGDGNDYYFIDGTSDVVIESANGGTDTEQSEHSHTLENNVENLVFAGTFGFTGIGNAGNNVVTGNSGANDLSGGLGDDTLIGAAGNDRMTGGSGNDVIDVSSGSDRAIYSDTLDAGDLIQGFAVSGSGQDFIDLDALFDGLNGGIASASRAGRVELVAVSGGVELQIDTAAGTGAGDGVGDITLLMFSGMASTTGLSIGTAGTDDIFAGAL